MTNPYRGKHGRIYRRRRDAMASRARANGETCANCGRDFDWGNPNGPQGFTADHPIALGNGGSLIGQQLVGLCRSCNARKRDVVTPIIRDAS